MKIILKMDSGDDYLVEIKDNNYSIEDFISNLYNNMGVLKNFMIKLGESDNYINPSHISSIEVDKTN